MRPKKSRSSRIRTVARLLRFALKFLADQGVDPLTNLRVVTVDMPVRSGRVLGFLWGRSMDRIYEERPPRQLTDEGTARARRPDSTGS